MKIVHVPARLTAETVYRFVAGVVDREGGPAADRIVLDFGRLSWIDASGMTGLSNTIEWLKRRGVVCTHRNAALHSEAARFLDDCGFFRTSLGGPLSPLSRTRSTTFPLCRVSHAQSHEYLEFRLMPWLMGTLSLNRASLHEIDVCIRELFNNINDHSGEEVGCVFVQHHPRIGTVAISISDFGVGIPDTIRRVRPFDDDADAIVFACEEGVSTRSRPSNMGIGLHYLIQNVVSRYRGSLRIHSGRGRVEVARGPLGGVERTALPSLGLYPGTFFDISIPTDGVERVGDGREDLEW